MSIKRDGSYGLFAWYPFRKEACIGGINTPQSVNEFLDITNEQDEYDYIILYDCIDQLTYAKKKLANDGIILLVVDNPLGISKFCTGKVKTYDMSKKDIERTILNNGFKYQKFYSVFPNAIEPQLIYAENYVPHEKLENRYIPRYEDKKRVFLQENILCDVLAQNGVLDVFANTFLVEISNRALQNDIQAVTLSLDRLEENSTITIEYNDSVEKKAANTYKNTSINTLANNLSAIKARGINVVDFKYCESSIYMPYINEQLANNYLQELLLKDKYQFLERLDEFYKIICESSEIVEENEMGPILRNGYIDLVPLNCFWNGKEYIVFDQEYVKDNVPAKLMLLRSIIIIYDGVNPENALVEPMELYARYNMLDCLDELSRMEREFINALRTESESDYFYSTVIFPPEIEKNYKRIIERDSDKYYMEKDEIILDVLIEQYKDRCFTNIENVIIWGTGAWCEKFLSFYENEINILAAVDINREKVGQYVHGIEIRDVSYLNSIDENTKVIVCVKDNKSIVRQLIEMGICNIGIYDAYYEYNRVYPDKRQDNESISKKYKVGYVSGVFDLYHIGHINMFRRAKEQCEYLIVAVASDEYVREHKKKEPFIPLEERVECVKSCRYVDEVFVTPYKYGGIDDAYRKYHYDVQFCGSDYSNNSWWLEQKSWLEERGSQLIFLSYTEQTSSTKIKKLIDKGLL